MPQKFDPINFSEEISADPQCHATLSSDRYTSSDFMHLEWEKIWTQCWLFAGLESDVKDVGEFFVYDIGRESVIVTRNEDNKISAFYNTCQHRGNKILTQESGWVKQVSCPYHGWTYGLDGELKKVPDAELFKDNVLCKENSLKSVHVETWAGMIFINMSENPASLKTFLGKIMDQLEPYHFENMQLVKHQSVTLDTNWKTVRDNFLEQYHVDFIHPQHASFVDCCDAQNYLWPFGHTHTCVESPVMNPRYPMPDEPPEYMIQYLKGLELNPEDYIGKVPEIRRVIQKQKRVIGKKLGFDYSELSDEQVSDVFQYDIFPNLFMTIHAERVWFYGPRPHLDDPNKCTFTKFSLMLPEDKIRDEKKGLELLPGSYEYEYSETRVEHEVFTRQDVIEGRNSMTVTIDQDIHYLNDMQAGMHSRGFNKAILSDDEGRLQHFHNWIDNWLSEDSSWSKVDQLK